MGVVGNLSPSKKLFEVPKWKVLERLLRPSKRDQRRKQLEMLLTGGWPPHIAVMHSNALWFRAQSAARYIESREHDQDRFESKLRKRVYGPDY